MNPDRKLEIFCRIRQTVFWSLDGVNFVFHQQISRRHDKEEKYRMGEKAV